MKREKEKKTSCGWSWTHFCLSKLCHLWFNIAYIIKIAKILLSPFASNTLAHILGVFVIAFLLSILLCADKSGLQSELTFVQFGPQHQKLSHFLWFSKDCLAYISTVFVTVFSLSILSCAEKSGLQYEPTLVQFGPQDQKLSHFWWFSIHCLAYISTIFRIAFFGPISSCAENSGLQYELTILQFGPQGQEISHF
jgi:hypothetical protein